MLTACVGVEDVGLVVSAESWAAKVDQSSRDLAPRPTDLPPRTFPRQYMTMRCPRGNILNVSYFY